MFVYFLYVSSTLMFPTHESKWDNNRLWDKGVGEEALHSVKEVYRSGKTKLGTCLPRGPRSRWARPMSSPPLRAIPTEQGYILPKGPPPEREKSPQRAPQWVRTSCNPSQRAIIPHERGPYGKQSPLSKDTSSPKGPPLSEKNLPRGPPNEWGLHVILPRER